MSLVGLFTSLTLDQVSTTSVDCFESIFCRTFNYPGVKVVGVATQVDPKLLLLISTGLKVEIGISKTTSSKSRQLRWENVDLEKLNLALTHVLTSANFKIAGFAFGTQLKMSNYTTNMYRYTK